MLIVECVVDVYMSHCHVYYERNIFSDRKKTREIHFYLREGMYTGTGTQGVCPQRWTGHMGTTGDILVGSDYGPEEMQIEILVQIFKNQF